LKAPLSYLGTEQIHLASVAQTLAGSSSEVAATPAGLASFAMQSVANWSESVSGIGQLSTTSEATTGTNNTTAMTPLKVAQVFAAPHAIGSGTPAAGAFTTLATSGLITAAASATVNTGAAALALGTDAANGAVNLGTAGTRAIAIGNATASTSVGITSGTGHVTLTSTGTGDIKLVAGDKVEVDAVGTVAIESSAAAISIGADDIDQAVNIAVDGERTLTMGSANGAAAVVVQTGTGGVSIANNAIAGNVVLGNKTGGTVLALETGLGNFTLDGVGATTYTVGASTTTGTITIGGTSGTGAITLGSSDGINAVNVGVGEGATTVNIATGATGAKAVNISTGAIAGTVTIGNVTGATSVNVNTGTGGFNVATTGSGDIILNSDDTVLIDADGVLELNSSAGIISIGNDADAHGINIGTGAAARPIIIGNVTTTTGLSLLTGTGNFALEGAVTSTYDISSTGANTGKVTIGSGTGARTVEIAGGGTGIKTINIGAAATADVITIGSGTGAGSTTISAGSGGIQLAGEVVIATAGKGLTVNGGAATDTIGTATLVAGTITILNTNISAADRIFLARTATNASTALGELSVPTINAATSFVITAKKPGTPADTETNDASTVSYFIVRQS